MALKYFQLILLSLLLFFSSCKSIQHISQSDVRYQVVSDSTLSEDEEINRIVAPYKAQLDAVMNEVLGTLPAELTKNRPESTLGNWVTDAVMERMKKEGHSVDFAIVNYGGLRVPYLSQGPLTRGELFELAPFENSMMILDVPGEKLDSFLLLVAEAGGWPVSKDVKLVISNKKVVSASIGGQPVSPSRIYKIATVDYVATGGDNMKVLIPLTRKETGLIFRDILIDHVKEANASGKPLTASIEGRIIQQ
jgi:2',3'-cyclic-nucleotide 2'-phosphodiesterase (5'-nucleotidase family)